MRQMRAALEKLIGQGELGAMVEKALAKPERPFQKVKREKSSSPAVRYHRQLRRALDQGAVGLTPCSFLDWPPGKPAMIAGNYCHIKGGLIRDGLRFVVVVYETAQPFFISGDKVYYGIVPADIVSPCNCKGYLHRGICLP